MERGRDIVMKGEKEIIAVDGGSSGYEEFVVMDIIGIKESNSNRSKRILRGTGLEAVLIGIEGYAREQ